MEIMLTDIMPMDIMPMDIMLVWLRSSVVYGGTTHIGLFSVFSGYIAFTFIVDFVPTETFT